MADTRPMETMPVDEWERYRKRLPKNFQLTADARGYCVWVNGRTRRVCGRLPKEEALKIFHRRHGEWSSDRQPEPEASDDLTVKQLAELFMERQEKRVRLGKLARRTYDDYRRVIEAFLKSVGPGRAVGELRPGDFGRYAETVKGSSPYTLSQHVAYIKAVFRWAYAADQIATPVRFGPDFVKPSASELRARREKVEKRLSPKEVRTLFKAAGPVQRAWIALGINGGFDNADVANLSREVIDWKEATLDFRRRKVGHERRIIPLRPETVKLLKAYKRPEPIDQADADVFFITRHGRRYCREKEHQTDAGRLEKATPINGVSSEFAKFMKRAGVVTDGRGYRSLRTTFRTLADAVLDERASHTIMGHRGGITAHVSAQYVEVVDRKRLQAVVDHVWSKIFGRRPGRWFAALAKREAATARDQKSPPSTSTSAGAGSVGPSQRPAQESLRTRRQRRAGEAASRGNSPRNKAAPGASRRRRGSAAARARASPRP